MQIDFWQDHIIIILIHTKTASWLFLLYVHRVFCDDFSKIRLFVQCVMQHFPQKLLSKLSAL